MFSNIDYHDLITTKSTRLMFIIIYLFLIIKSLNELQFLKFDLLIVNIINHSSFHFD